MCKYVFYTCLFKEDSNLFCREHQHPTLFVKLSSKLGGGHYHRLSNSRENSLFTKLLLPLVMRQRSSNPVASPVLWCPSCAPFALPVTLWGTDLSFLYLISWIGFSELCHQEAVQHHYLTWQSDLKNSRALKSSPFSV